ncbi:hypothetical protein [Streptomyces luteolus]|uniref:Uncharacterized protein n=1 Tax=Streptomyces luteolus TaxID=3043615 RepID=A0ABT6T1M6_9ACTN|nr:hypothetical protein [Streptomyces sp. B-S-A12]MDI3421754.1 hypothetical protein [Streptomyces sp. B-S-A12]
MAFNVIRGLLEIEGQLAPLTISNECCCHADSERDAIAQHLSGGGVSARAVTAVPLSDPTMMTDWATLCFLLHFSPSLRSPSSSTGIESL